ncbi:MAG TPA: hypothetical protein VGX23_31405 [Actinocrinis sp.]|nr:hypothetical protein [Actinocrinis sp.]
MKFDGRLTVARSKAAGSAIAYCLAKYETPLGLLMCQQLESKGRQADSAFERILLGELSWVVSQPSAAAS